MKRLFNIVVFAMIFALIFAAVKTPASTAHAAENTGQSFSPLMSPNAWSALGSGISGVTSSVRAIAINGSDIYVAGSFTDAGGDTSADRIAKWDGSSWSALGSGISNGLVNSLVFNGSNLYVGGSFTDAGGNVSADYIAQWNGSSWAPLGDGLGNTVNAIGVSGLDIYVAGSFTNAGVDVNADYIAKLDGGTWAALGASPLNGTINTIVVAGATVYAGGTFTNLAAGGNPSLNHIATWDGSTWNALGSGLDNTVFAATLVGSDLYVGGAFSDAGGNSTADRVAKWDGSSWSPLGSGGMGAGSVSVNAFAISGSNLYVGGNFIDAGGDANADYIARWDGSAWSTLGATPLNNNVNAILINGLDLYAGGSFTDAGGNTSGDRIARFEFDTTAPAVTSFNALSPSPSIDIPISAFTASDDAAVAGYLVNESGTAPASSDAGWTTSAPTAYTVGSNGSYTLYPWVKDTSGNVSAVYGSPLDVSVDTTPPTVSANIWNPLGSGLSNNPYDLAISGSDLYAVGSFLDAGSYSNGDRAAKWNGTSWSPMGSGLSAQTETVMVDGSIIYAGGNFQNAGGNASADNIAQWNGSNWSAVGTGLNGTVSDIAASGSNFYAAGSFTNASGNANADYIARWNGSSWSALGTTPLSSNANAVAIDGSDVYVGGSFQDVGGNASADFIAKWNGSSWSALGSGLNSTVIKIILSNGDLYAGGTFTDAGGNASADRIAKWNGTSWSPLGSGLNGTVYVMAARGTDIYAGGNFTDAGGDTNADYIAKWNGTSWSALGSTPLNGAVHGITVDGSKIYASGSFTDAGGNSNADRIALFLLDTTSPIITAFAMPTESKNLNIPITDFSASDDVAVTGYLITESSTVPSANTPGWTASVSTAYTVSADGSYTLYPWAKDGTGNISAVHNTPMTVTVDTTQPTVTAFSVPSSSASLNVPISTFNGSDNFAVTGFRITESSTPPSAGAGGWTVSAPTTYTVAGEGSHTLYPWAKDALGNVSAVYGSPKTVTVDVTKPIVSSFTVTSPSTSLNIPITIFTASDNIAISAYLISESSTLPSSGAAGWSVSKPTTFTVASQGSHTLYPWVKDAAGNVSALFGSPRTVSVDTAAPTVTVFSAPASSSSLNIPINTFNASDVVGVTGYLITESSTPPAAGVVGWSASKPTTFAVASEGLHTLYPWAKDAVGHVSSVYGSPASVEVDTTLPDTSPPSVDSFTAVSPSASLDISISSFSASDNMSVTDYLITESSTQPASSDSGWSASAPTTYTVASDGTYTLYPWAKDAAGNVSSAYGSPVSVEVDATSPVDTTAPSVDAFTTASASNSLNISITAFTASDDTAVTGYIITESSTPPSSGDAGWTVSAPTSYTVGSDGSYTLYPWAKDAVGNVSAVYGTPASVLVGTSLTVMNTNDSGSGSLRNILADAASGDIVTFDSSLSGQTIYLASTLTLTKDVTIDGSALASQITLSGDSDNNGTGDVRVLHIVDDSLVDVALNSLTITKGQSDAGGAILNEAYLTITNSNFINNSSTGSGGAITSNRPLTITDTTFSGNSSTGSTDGGGAIINNSTLTISNSTFSGNTADGSGGSGGAIFNTSLATITNSTFAGNSAAAGGAILTTNMLTIQNSTISGNSAVVTGGLTIEGWTTNLINTIIANNTASYPPSADDCTNSATIGTNTNNLIGDGSCAPSLTGDPQLGPLQDNGGPTQTMALDTGSPAINAGNDATCLAADQRGAARPQGGHCDLGAYEYEYSQLDVVIGASQVGSYELAARESLRQSFPGVNDGPVKIISTENIPIIAAERLIYKVNNLNTSFWEMMGLPNSQLDTTYWLPWYNNQDLDTQLRFGNVSGSTATVHVYIGGVEMTGSPFTLAPGASTRQSFVGINNGPVKIESDVPIVAAERVIYKVNNTNTSFSEMMALPNSQLDTTYWLPWYNNKDLDTQLRFANVSGSTATVHVLIGGAEMSGSPFTLAPGESARKSFPSVNSGPVKIESDVPIVAAERLIYKVNNLNTSFSEAMALPNSQLDTTYWLPWYNNKDLDTQLRFGVP